MKYVVIIPDGMSGEPISSLGNKTTMEYAHTPNMDFLSQSGELGLVQNVPQGFPPGSDVANLSIFGYDPQKYYSGRAPIEAVSKGLILNEQDTVFRVNFVTVKEGIMSDFTAGHISSQEGSALIDILNKDLQSYLQGGDFYAGVSYRNLFKISDMNFSGLETVPPHDIVGQKIDKYFPVGNGADFLNNIMMKSTQVLENNSVSSNMIWMWGQGKKLNIPNFENKYGLQGAVITAVDLIKGLGVAAGMEYIHVPGITGFVDTNYAGKAEYALKALAEKDIVFIHIEAPDESGHLGDRDMKIKSIENIDKLIVGSILKGLKDTEHKILILPDHPTPISLKTHSKDPVPFLIYASGKDAVSDRVYSEIEAKRTGIFIKDGYQLMEKFVS